jgi:hypothetical protein
MDDYQCPRATDAKRPGNWGHPLRCPVLAHFISDIASDLALEIIL